VKDWGWVPWVLTAALGVATIVFGVLAFRLSKAVRRDTRAKDREEQGVNWLEIARSELTAKIDQGKAETLLAVNNVDHRVERLDDRLRRLEDRALTVIDQVGALGHRLELVWKAQREDFVSLAGAINQLAEGSGAPVRVDTAHDGIIHGPQGT
jgi:hypothetical protein